MHQLTQAMARVVEEMNVPIHLNTPVKEVVKKREKIEGILLEDGELIYLDDVVVNADFGYAVTK